VLLHFPTASAALRELVVIDPQFLADVMSGVVTFNHRLVKSGILQHSDLPQIWQKFPVEVHPSLLELLETFEIAYVVGAITRSPATN
jgi:hypothetical protein